MKTLKIEVTRQDIEKGLPDNCHYCPIALAAKRALKINGTLDVSVGNDRLEIDIPEHSRSFRLPQDAQLFVTQFDETSKENDLLARCLPEPFSFELEVDEDVYAYADREVTHPAYLR